MNKEELIAKYGDERVFCVSNHHLNSWFRVKPNKIEALIEGMEKHGYFDLRHNAEIDYTAKQVIPYVVLKSGDEYFVTTRLKGDSRLVGGSSIAVGGHINPCDVGPMGMRYPSDTINNCLVRELLEETTITMDDLMNAKLDFKTVFVDESSDVSKVHVCLLVVVEVDDKSNIDIKETEKLTGQWMNGDEVMGIIDRFEGWSKIAIDLLDIKQPETVEAAPKKTRKKSKTTKTEDNE